MATEIEHKYLVIDNSYMQMATSKHTIVQGYIDRTPEHVVRVRQADRRCFITIKGVNHGDTRLEFEYPVPEEDFGPLLSLCEGKVIKKKRYMVPYEGYTWEVDVFESPSGLPAVAEIELESSTHTYPLPPFVGKEVTGMPEYYNTNL